MTEYGIKALKTKVKHGDVLSTEEKNFIGRVLEKQITKQVKGKSVTHEGYVANCPSCNKFIILWMILKLWSIRHCMRHKNGKKGQVYSCPSILSIIYWFKDFPENSASALYSAAFSFVTTTLIVCLSFIYFSVAIFWLSVYLDPTFYLPQLFNLKCSIFNIYICNFSGNFGFFYGVISS